MIWNIAFEKSCIKVPVPDLGRNPLLTGNFKITLLPCNIEIRFLLSIRSCLGVVQDIKQKLLKVQV